MSSNRRPRASHGVITFDDIQPGDRVTYLAHAGGIGRHAEQKERTGVAVMRGPHGWVLNLGGKHGTPGVVEEEKFVRASRKSSGRAENPRKDPHSHLKGPHIISYTETFEPWEEGEDQPDSETEENEPHPVELDDYDRGEDLTIADLAAKHILENGGGEASSSGFHPGIWYNTVDDDVDYRTGQRSHKSFHLKGFEPNQEREVYEAVTNRKALGRSGNPAKGRTRAAKTTKGNLQVMKALEAVLVKHGHVVEEEGPVPSLGYPARKIVEVTTPLGTYRASASPNLDQQGASVMGRFQGGTQVYERARAAIGDVNQFSGKWNHYYFTSDAKQAAADLDRALSRLGGEGSRAQNPSSRGGNSARGSASLRPRGAEQEGDIFVNKTGRGGIWTFEALSKKGKAWVKKNVDDNGRQAGTSFDTDDSRYADEIIEGALRAGLHLTIPGGHLGLRQENPVSRPSSKGKSSALATRGGEEEVHEPFKELARELTGKACYVTSCFTTPRGKKR